MISTVRTSAHAQMAVRGVEKPILVHRILHRIIDICHAFIVGHIRQTWGEFLQNQSVCFFQVAAIIDTICPRHYYVLVVQINKINAGLCGAWEGNIYKRTHPYSYP
jgi:hypothetical protein